MKVWCCDENKFDSEYVAELVRQNFPDWEVFSFEGLPTYINCDILISDYYFNGYDLGQRLSEKKAFELIIVSGSWFENFAGAKCFLKPQADNLVSYLKEKVFARPRVRLVE